MIDYIIVGQGLAGTILHRKLTLAGQHVVCIDDGHKQSSSKIAAGMVNPITGRKYVKSWRIEDFLPVARKTYADLSALLGQELERDVVIHRALYSIKDENIWHGRKEDPRASQFILEGADTAVYADTIKNVLSYGSLAGLQVDLTLLIDSYRAHLQKDGQILEEAFAPDRLSASDQSIQYGDYTAKGIVFAEGARAVTNPLWNMLPFEPVKGEVLLVRIEGDPFPDVLRHKMFITPFRDDLYWIGSGYEREYTDGNPTSEGRDRLVGQLADVLTLPYEIVEHIAGIRPSVRGRKPFLGHHPQQPNTFIFNGMGTKGTSLAPYWAEHMVAYLLEGTELDMEVDIRRFLP